MKIQTDTVPADVAVITTNTGDGDFNIEINGILVAFISTTGILKRAALGDGSRKRLEEIGVQFDYEDRISTN